MAWEVTGLTFDLPEEGSEVGRCFGVPSRKTGREESFANSGIWIPAICHRHEAIMADEETEASRFPIALSKNYIYIYVLFNSAKLFGERGSPTRCALSGRRTRSQDVKPEQGALCERWDESNVCPLKSYTVQYRQDTSATQCTRSAGTEVGQSDWLSDIRHTW